MLADMPARISAAPFSRVGGGGGGIVAVEVSLGGGGVKSTSLAVSLQLSTSTPISLWTSPSVVVVQTWYRCPLARLGMEYVPSVPEKVPTFQPSVGLSTWSYWSMDQAIARFRPTGAPFFVAVPCTDPVVPPWAQMSGRCRSMSSKVGTRMLWRIAWP